MCIRFTDFFISFHSRQYLFLFFRIQTKERSLPQKRKFKNLSPSHLMMMTMTVMILKRKKMTLMIQIKSLVLFAYIHVVDSSVKLLFYSTIPLTIFINKACICSSHSSLLATCYEREEFVY